MPQFFVLIAVLVLFYGWHKTNPARVIPQPKKRKRSRSNKRRKQRRDIEEDCLFDDDDLLEFDDWRSDLAYSGMSGNYYHND